MGKLLIPIIVTMFPKNYSVEIAKHLHHEDFQCKCSYPSCDHSLIHRSLIYSHEDLVRGLTMNGMKSPPVINSGFRCYLHNKKSGGHEKSFHQQGLAVDYSLRNMTSEDRLFFIELCKRFFDKTIAYDTFVHCRNSAKER